MDLALGEFTVFIMDSMSVFPYDQALVDTRRQASINEIYSMQRRLPMFLPPGVTGLFTTQKVEVPSSCIGLVHLRSTYARLGLLMSPVVADPGFQGQLTIALHNPTANKILFNPGDKVFSIHFVALWLAEQPYAGKYQGQDTLTLPKADTGDK